MIDAADMIVMLERNHAILLRETAGITHEESLIQPPYNGNCFNWVLGHIVMSRNWMQILFGLPPLWPEAQRKRYDRYSEPITSGADAVRFEKMLEDLETLQTLIVSTLRTVQTEQLTEMREFIPNQAPAPVYTWMQFMLWHESYHVGQTNILRQVAGKNDKTL
jgi:uncharacterized damage-inducible protein DinB